METSNLVKKLALVLAISGAFVWQAEAIIAFDTGSTSAGNQTGGSYDLGMVFTVGASPIDVTALGAFDPTKASLGSGSSAITVAIYAWTGTGTSGSALVDATFGGAASGYSFIGNSAMQDVTSTILDAGTYLIVADNYGNLGSGGTLSAFNANQPHVGITAPSIDSGNAGYVTFSSGGERHNNGTLGGAITGNWSLIGSGVNYAAGNFEYNLVPVPEAAGFTLAGVALLGLVYAGRCYSQKQKLKTV